MHLPFGYDSYKVRQDVSQGFDRANNAKKLVVANALKGEILRQGWNENAEDTSTRIKIDSKTGIIIITYPLDIDGGGKTLLLLPIYRWKGRTYPLSLVLNSKFPLDEKDILWVCTSNLTLSKKPFVYKNLGTLNSKYAPVKCRFSPDWLEKT